MTKRLTLKEFIDRADFDKVMVCVLGEEKFTTNASDIWFNEDEKYNEYLDREINKYSFIKDGIRIDITPF